MSRPVGRLAASLLALALAGCGTAHYGEEPPAPASTAQAQLVDELPEEFLIAHRGGPSEFPEASMVAYRASAAAGFPLEMDLRTLADGTVVLMHDWGVDRTTNGTGSVSSKTAAQWSQLRIDGGGGAPPTWQQILDEFGGRSLLVVETKDRASVAPFIASVHELGLEGSVIAQSFNRDDAQAFADAGLVSMWLSNDVPDFAAVKAAGIDWVAPSTAVKDRPGYIAAAHEAGLLVAVWTVTKAGEARQLRSEGADAVFSNDPWAMTGIAAPHPRTWATPADRR